MLPLDARGLPAENKTRYHCKESGHLAFCGFEFITFQKPEIPSSTFQFYQIAFLSCFKKRTKKTGTRNSYCIVFRLWRNDFSLTFCFVLVFNYETHARNISPLGILFAYFTTTVWIPLDQCDLNTIKKTALQITLVSEALLMLLPALLIHNMPNSSIVFGVSHVVILYLHIPGILET